MFKRLRESWKDRANRRRDNRLKELFSALGRWQRSAGYYRESLDRECTTEQWVARQQEHRKAQNNVESIKRKILTIEMPQARLISD